MNCSKTAAFEAALKLFPPTKPGIWTSKQEERIGQEKGRARSKVGLAHLGRVMGRERKWRK